MLSAKAQTKETNDFHDAHPEAFTLFFYKSTIRMLDPTNSEEYFNMIKDIERAKFLRFDESEISDSDLQNYITAIKNVSFEEGMTMRQGSGTANVFIRDAESEKSGIIFIMKSEDQVFILDIVGKVQVSKLMELTQKINVFESLF
jgi:hypothetical protein